MALTYTPAGETGFQIPDFSAKGINVDHFSKSDLLPLRPTLFMFICNHCPYVQAIEDRLIELGTVYKDLANIVAICSNDPSDYEEDSFDNLKRRSLQKAYSFTYIHDEEQSIARAFGAVCTPDFFLFDKAGRLFYRGRLDDSWKNEKQVSKSELKLAIDSILQNKPLDFEEVPSMGCSIKWKD